MTSLRSSIRLPRLLTLLWCSLPALSFAARDLPEVAAGKPAVLTALRPAHPRLLALDEDLIRTRELIRTDPLARKWREILGRSADKLLAQPPVKHELQGPRLLQVSRAALGRIQLLGLLYRLDGDDRYARRAEAELRAVCAFPDWNPSHFLDTAEMSFAVGLGYDWFHDALTSETRAVVRDSLVRLGLEPAIELYRRQTGFPVMTNNWNQVCNGGIVLGALAVAEDEPEIAAYILRMARESLPRAMGGFTPDGGWVEGPSYWAYTTRYCCYLFAGLESALGTTFGLDRTEGFPETGSFRLAMAGPSGLHFNWGDGSEKPGAAAQLFWLSRRFNRPALAWAERKYAGESPEPLDLLWIREGRSPRAAGAPLDWRFRGIEVASLREAWDDPQSSFVAFKGGDNDAPHANLDLGSFVFDADGERWAAELGGDDYNLPGYWERGGRRYKYYRMATRGQNTLLINGRNQDRRARAPIVAFRTGTAGACAVVDLTDAYMGEVAQVRRGFSLCGDRRHLLVQDEIQSTAPVEIRWTMHTRAEGATSGSAALLTSGDAALRLQVLEPAGAVVEIESARQDPPQNPNRGVRRVTVRLPEKSASARLAVLLSPASAEDYRPEPVPLDEW